MDYQLEIKQIVDYPRCRIYREFLRTLMQDRNIRTNGSSYLFYFMILCSYANFRTSYRRIEGISYLIEPGEWVLKSSELSEWFRTRFQHQAISILDYLQEQHYISYKKIGRGNLIKFKITDWEKNNTVLNYNCPCLKDVGFFFFPVSAVHELISVGKCSEMDIVLDLWIHAIFNDEQVQGSDIGPVVYFRNCTGNPRISYMDLSLRWGISKSSVSRVLNKLQDKEYLSLINFTGKHGSIIYLCSYLSTMFSISDVMIDKEEIEMTFQLPVHIADKPSAPYEAITEEQVIFEESSDSVPEDVSCVPKSHMQIILQKIAGILATQGILCCECSHTQYKLYRLSDCKDTKYSLVINCPVARTSYRFELRFLKSGSSDTLDKLYSTKLKGGNEHEQ